MKENLLLFERNQAKYHEDVAKKNQQWIIIMRLIKIESS